MPALRCGVDAGASGAVETKVRTEATKENSSLLGRFPCADPILTPLRARGSVFPTSFAR